MLSKFRRVPNLLNSNKINKFNNFNPPIQNQFYQNQFYQKNCVTNYSTVANTFDKENVGLNYFINNVLRKTGVGILGTLATASTLTYVAPEFLAQNALPLLLVGGIGSIASIFLYKENDFTVKNENHKGQLIPVAQHSNRNKLVYTGLSLSNGLVIAPVVLMASVINPLILPSAIVLSAGTMAGASWYTLNQKNSNISAWGPSLYGALVGMVGMGLISLITLPFFPQLAMLWFTVDPYIGIALFSALTAYDTHRATEDYKEGNYDDLGSSITFFLNFINLFVRFMELLSRFQPIDK